MSEETAKKPAGKIDPWFTSEVYSTMGWCMLFASTGTITMAIAQSAAFLAFPLAWAAIALVTLAGLGFFALAARERKRMESEENEKVVKVQLGPDGKSKSVTLKIDTSEPEKNNTVGEVVGKHTANLKTEHEQRNLSGSTSISLG